MENSGNLTPDVPPPPVANHKKPQLCRFLFYLIKKLEWKAINKKCSRQHQGTCLCVICSQYKKELFLHGSLYQPRTSSILTGAGATKQQENSSRALNASPALLCKVYSALSIVIGPCWRWSSYINWHGHKTTWFEWGTSGTTAAPNWWGMSHCSEHALSPGKSTSQHPARSHERPS